MTIYAKIFGLGVDRNGNPDYIYTKLGLRGDAPLEDSAAVKLLSTLCESPEEDITIISADEYHTATENEEEKRHARKNNL